MPKDVTGPLATPEVLALPTMAWTPASQSPWRFGGAIGLGIVAAMSDGGSRRHKPAPPAAGLTRSQPIPIAAPLLPAPAVRGGKPQPRCAERMARVDREEEEFSEGHTWVISHVGGYPVRRMVYFDDGYDGGGVFHESPERWVAILPPPSDFLSCCFLCRKKLLGLDIFMYRGEKGFCSAECRYQQMLRDEQRETKKDGSKAVELLKLPASLPFFSNSVAAA